jgi:hypothetical protein
MNCYQSRLVSIDDRNNSEDKVDRNVISSYKYIDVIKKEKTNEDEVDDDDEERQFEFDGSICDEKYNKDEDAVNNNNKTLLCKSSVKYRSMGGTVLEQTTQQFNITRPRTTYKADCIKNSIFPVVVPQTTTTPNEAYGCCNGISYCANTCI